VVPRDRIIADSGLILRTPNSVLFVIPWGRHWIIGTTDSEWDLDLAHPAASRRDIDYLLCDLPPGTGDIAISLGQMLPQADMIVVTTPQQAAQKVALRAGKATEQTGMRVMGVIENMATFIAPDTGKEYDIFGSGGGQELADELGTELLGRVPIDPRLREGGDSGVPMVLSEPDAPASKVLNDIASEIIKRTSTLIGRSLPLSVS
jgi:ATP-binding protein involved in chromosome partitioning